MALVEHVYGRSITFRYTPIANAEAFVAADLVSARLYGPTTYPTEGQIANTDGGELAEVTEWELVNEEGTGDPEYAMVFPARTDASPTSLVECDRFYIALNYHAEDAGPVVQDVEQIFVYRTDGLTSKIRVTAQDVFNLESKIEDFVGENILWVEAKIEAAAEEFLARLEGRGYPRRHQFNVHKLNAATTRKACAYCCSDLAGDGNETWFRKADRWDKMAELLFEVAQVGVDPIGDDRPAVNQKVQSGAVGIVR